MWALRNGRRRPVAEGDTSEKIEEAAAMESEKRGMISRVRGCEKQERKSKRRVFRGFLGKFLHNPISFLSDRPIGFPYQQDFNIYTKRKRGLIFKFHKENAEGEELDIKRRKRDPRPMWEIPARKTEPSFLSLSSWVWVGDWTRVGPT